MIERVYVSVCVREREREREGDRERERERESARESERERDESEIHLTNPSLQLRKHAPPRFGGGRFKSHSGRAQCFHVQGYLAHKEQPPPRTTMGP